MKIKKLVTDILLNNREARNSDKELYIRVLVHTGHSASLYGRFVDVLRDKSLPSYDSVSRARRWVQAHIDGTQADDKVEAMREIEEEAYREEYGSGRR